MKNLCRLFAFSNIILHLNSFAQSSSADVWYDFSNSLSDASPNGNTLTAANGAALGTDRLGNANSAYVFDGANDYLYRNAAAGLPSGADTRKVTLWFKTTDTSTSSDVLIHWGAASTNNSFGIALGTSWGLTAGKYGVNIFGYGSDVKNFVNLWGIRDSWQYLEVVTYQDTLKVYFNGTKIKTIYKVWNTTADQRLNIGRANWGDYFAGSIDEIRVYGHGTPLPIQLASFSGKCEGENNILNWTTASETNNDFYTIESSNDATHWQTIATLDGAGNSTSTLHYSFTDKNPKDVITYYRLKQTDFDGKFEYFKIIHVTACEEDWSKFSVYPNPSNDAIYLNYTGDISEIQSIEVLNTLGEIVYTNKSFEKTIHLLNYLSGTYFVRFKTSTKTFTERIIIKK